jgi:RsiW-degrading membrane proteinase PrsW (M82 family)
MKNFLLKMLSTSDEVSEMRVMVLLCVLTAIAIAGYGIYKNPTDYSGLSLLCGTFLTTAFGGKVLSKRDEVSQKEKS